jgi:hypothetical protein
MEVSALGKPDFKIARTITEAVWNPSTKKIVLKCGFLKIREYDGQESFVKTLNEQISKAVTQKGHLLVDGDQYYVTDNKTLGMGKAIAQIVYQSLIKAYDWAKVKFIEGKDWFVVQYNTLKAKIDIYKRAFIMSRELARTMTAEKLEQLKTMLEQAGFSMKTT